MVRSLLTMFGKEIRGMHEAAYLLAFFALCSQLLALVRDRLLAADFGASHTLDLYYAAFRIPDFLFATIASLLSLYALLPVLTRLEREREGYMISFLEQCLLLFFVGMGAVSLVVFLLTPWLVPLVVPGIQDPQLIVLVRILLLQPILLGASNILGSLTQLRHRFFLYSISPLLYNFGIIFGVIALYPRMGLAGLGWGVVLGAAMHCALQIPFFSMEKVSHRLPFKTAMREILTVLSLSVPRTLALAATQISLLILVALASFFSAGSISVFMFAYNLQAVPLTIIGVSYSVAAFPTLARLHATGDHGEFIKYVETALRHIFFWCIPATVFFIVLRAQLVRVILGAGAFDWSATRLTAAALALFIISLAAQSVTMLIARAYYAAGNSKKPLYFGLSDILVSVLSAVGCMWVFQHNEFVRHFVESLLRVGDVPGTLVLVLAFGYCVGSVAEFLIGLIVFMRDFKIPQMRVSRLIFQSFSASVIGGGVSYLFLAETGIAGTINTTGLLIVQGACAGILGLLVTAGVLALLKNQELFEAVAAFRRRFQDVRGVAIETTDISS
ncbi:oligosaccharide flippase family protein [Patescibacteria group bacterium]|nr:oligosaccharide flippase family protein [Patescibacteria group bacterium]